MKTLRELAECYERWASDSEATATTIVANVNYLDEESRVQQRNWAEALIQEAQNLRQQAARLRITRTIPTLAANQSA
jgi:hypothetical protein